MRRIITTTVSGLIASAMITMLPTHAAADEPAGRMMLVLDSSGSMAQKAGGGQTKIEAAKQALSEVVDGLPEQQSVGLRVYGAKVFSAGDEGACEDSQKVVDLGIDNRDGLRQAIDGYKPYGETPTGYALQQAGKDLGGEGQRTIVLVSDGEPTCSPDPCTVAAKLSQDGIDLKIDVVGLDVSGKARKQLQCVAKAGNGSYYDADDADSITKSLVVSSTRASRPFDLTGTPVKGSPEPSSAPAISRGQYLDTFGTGDGLWYRIERSAPNSTIHVGVTHRSKGTGNFGDKAYVGVYAGPDEERCNYSTTFARGNIAYAASSSWRPEPSAGGTQECNTASTLWINVKQTSSRRDFAGEPVEIAVYEEPPLADPSGADLPAAPEQLTWTTLSPGSPTPDVVPGTAISNATVVTDGTYQLDIVPGETQVIAVPLDWGQNLQAQLDGTLTREHRASSFDAPWVQVLGPVRQAVDTDEYGTDSKPADWTSRTPTLDDDATAYRTGSQSYTIGYRNRSQNEAHLNGSSLAGRHYVQVSYGADNEAPLAYTLTLQTNSQAGSATPQYDEIDRLAVPEANSPLVTASAESAATATTPGNVQVADKPAESSGFPAMPVALGALGVVAIIGAGVVLLRGRNTASR